MRNWSYGLEYMREFLSDITGYNLCSSKELKFAFEQRTKICLRLKFQVVALTLYRQSNWRLNQYLWKDEVYPFVCEVHKPPCTLTQKVCSDKNRKSPCEMVYFVLCTKDKRAVDYNSNVVFEPKKLRWYSSLRIAHPCEIRTCVAFNNKA